MKEYLNVFKRVEAKYLLSAEQYSALSSSLSIHMEPNEYPESLISNIYYDTEDYSIIRQSIEKPVYKQKLRLRGYGEIKENSNVFAEIKSKYKGVVYKRRVKMKLDEAELLLNSGILTLPETQIISEIIYLRELYRLQPKVYLSYDRIALREKHNPDFRLTFDRNIRFRESRLSLCSGSDGKSIIDNDNVLMELKIPGAMPIWMSRLLSELEIFPASFSKYGKCYENFILPELLNGGQNHVA